MKAIGIDLGTTNSLVAVVEGGTARALGDREGRKLLPSVVYYAEGAKAVVGVDAQTNAAAFPTDTIVSVKRFMGRAAAEVDDALHSYDLRQDGAVLRLHAGGVSRTPVEISADILKKLRDRARAQIDLGISKAVITVPAYFDDTQRQATRQAGALAGLEVMRLLNEPTAAALAYGLDKQEEGRFAVFDLGGGTFDISLLHLIDGVFEVLSTGGDTQLGGDDFDRAVATALLTEAGVDPADASPGLKRRALDAATAAKIAVTDLYETQLSLVLDSGETFSRVFSRDDLARQALPLLQRVEGPCKQALRDANLRADQLDGVVLVGGSTRSPFVKRFVERLFGRKPLADINPDEVVALGAAIQADLLSPDSDLRGTAAGDVLLLDITPLSLGLETMGGVVEKVIPRCSQIPASRAQSFTTYVDGQTGMDIHVLQGERELVEDCRSLAKFRLEGIPPKAAGLARVQVIFQVDADGVLKVSAREESTGVEQSVQVTPTHGLDDSAVEQMLQASLDHAEADVNARMLRTARMEAERVLMPLYAALKGDTDLLTADEHVVINAAMADLKAAIEGEDHRPIQDLTEMLDTVSGGFAQRRMERALKQGLVDKKVSVDALASEMKDAPIGGQPH